MVMVQRARILPMAYLYKELEFSELIRRVHQVSCITHAHPRSQIACGIYISIAVALLKGADKNAAYQEGLQKVQNIYTTPEYSTEMQHFQRVFNGAIDKLPVEEISSDGYVIDTLEASLWCFLNSSSYSEAVLKAVNLGYDTDTTAAVTGGLASIFYSLDNIPSYWIELVARKNDIIDARKPI